MTHSQGTKVAPSARSSRGSEAASKIDRTGDLGTEAVAALGTALRQLLADVYALYLKTKNFHWHICGPHFRDYHLLLDEQAGQLLAMTDVVAERARKLGAPALRSIGDVARHQRLRDNDEAQVAPAAMLSELREDNLRFTRSLRDVHELCDQHRDVATASLIENWIDEAEHRVWFLAEILEVGR